MVINFIENVLSDKYDLIKARGKFTILISLRRLIKIE